MTTAYLVTTGSYSDYRVKGVFLNPEEAERAKILWGADNDVEEYEIGAMPDWTNDWTPWYVSMAIDGNYAVANPENVEYLDDQFKKLNEIKLHYGEKSIYIYVAAKTAEQAIKVANEKRIQWIAAQ